MVIGKPALPVTPRGPPVRTGSGFTTTVPIVVLGAVALLLAVTTIGYAVETETAGAMPVKVAEDVDPDGDNTRVG